MFSDRGINAKYLSFKAAIESMFSESMKKYKITLKIYSAYGILEKSLLEL